MKDRKIPTVILDEDSYEDKKMNIHFGLYSRRFGEFLIELADEFNRAEKEEAKDSADVRSTVVGQQFSTNGSTSCVFFNQNHEVCMVRNKAVRNGIRLSMISDSEFVNLLGITVKMLVSRIKGRSKDDSCQFLRTSFTVREAELIGMLLSKTADCKIRKSGYSDEEISEMKGLSEKNPVTEELWRERFKELKDLRQRLKVQQEKDAEELKGWAREQLWKFKAEIAKQFNDIVKKNQVEYFNSIVEILEGVEDLEAVQFDRLLPNPEFFLEFGSLNESDLLMMTAGAC